MRATQPVGLLPARRSRKQVIGAKVQYFRPKRLAGQPVRNNQLRPVPQSFHVVEDVLPTASITQPGAGDYNAAGTGLHGRTKTSQTLDGLHLPLREPEYPAKAPLVLP